MSSLKNLLLSVALLGIFGLPAQAQIAVGDAFPNLATAQLVGALPATAGKVLVVDFWASWCAPCKASFPALAQLHADYASRGVVIIGVSEDDQPRAYDSFIKKLAPPFVTVRDAEHKLARAVKPPAMPTTYVIDRSGRVLHVFTGYHGPDSEKALRAALDHALSL